jgi:hypothetical protein
LVGRFADQPASCGVDRSQLGVAELERDARTWIAKIEHGGEGHLVAIHVPRQEIVGNAALPEREAVQLCDCRLALQGEIESGEALRRVPASAMQTSAGA